MNIGIIGSGRVGTTFGLYFKKNDLLINGFYDNNFESAQESAEITNTNIYSLKEIIIDNDLIMICVKDDSIKNIVNEIKSLNINLANKYFCHTSGVYSSNELLPLKEMNGTIASLHPVLSISDKINQVDLIDEAHLTFEGQGENYNKLKTFFERVFNNFIEYKGNKGLYHAAACITSNYLNTLLNKALELYIESGLSKDDALNIMKPLVMASIENFFDKGPSNSLTGPISRGDNETVKMHLDCIEKLKRDDLKDLYCNLGLLTTKLAYENKYIELETEEKIMEIINNER